MKLSTFINLICLLAACLLVNIIQAQTLPQAPAPPALPCTKDGDCIVLGPGQWECSAGFCRDKANSGSTAPKGTVTTPVNTAPSSTASSTPSSSTGSSSSTGLAPWVIFLIVLGGILIFIGMPIIYCFFAGLLCFAKRQRKSSLHSKLPLHQKPDSSMNLKSENRIVTVHPVPATSIQYASPASPSTSVSPRPKKDYSDVVQHLRMSRADPIPVSPLSGSSKSSPHVLPSPSHASGRAMYYEPESYHYSNASQAGSARKSCDSDESILYEEDNGSYVGSYTSYASGSVQGRRV